MKDIEKEKERSRNEFDQSERILCISSIEDMCPYHMNLMAMHLGKMTHKRLMQ